MLHTVFEVAKDILAVFGLLSAAFFGALYFMNRAFTR
jgi:hypothetical protein